MAPSLTSSTPSIDTHKRKRSEGVTPVTRKPRERSGTHVSTSAEDADDSDHDIHVAKLARSNLKELKFQQPVKSQRVAPQKQVTENQTNSSLFDRPNPLVAWKLRSKPIHVREASHQQQQTTGRFYTKDSSLGQSHLYLFNSKSRTTMAQIILMMETTLGMEHHGDDRCQACIDRGIPCVRYIESARLQIRNCGSACAWCRFHVATGGCSKAAARQNRQLEGGNDEGGESDRSALNMVAAPSHFVVTNSTGAVTTNDNDRRTRRKAVPRGTSKTKTQPVTSTPKVKAEHPVVLSDQAHPVRSLSDHPILRLEELIDELSEDDAQEAQTFIDLIKRNLEKGRDTEGPASLLKNLLAPAKQRITEHHRSLSEAKQRVAEKYRRISRHMAQAAQKMKLFHDADEAPDVSNVEDDLTRAQRGESDYV